MSHRATLVSKSVREGRRQSQDSERERAVQKSGKSGVRGTEEEEFVGGAVSQAWFIYIKVRLRNLRSAHVACASRRG